MSGLMRRLLISIVGVVAVLFTVIVGDAFYTGHTAKVFLQDLRNLDAAGDRIAQFRILQRKYHDRTVGEKCAGDICFDEIVIDNRFLSDLFPRTEIRTQFHLDQGSLREFYMTYTSGIFKENSPIVSVQESFVEFNPALSGEEDFDLNPHGRDQTQTWNGIVVFGKSSTPKQKQAALELNLGCLTAFGGCKDISELLPAVWKRNGPGAVSSRMRSSSDSIAEAAQPLPD